MNRNFISIALTYQPLLARAAVVLACLCAISSFLYGVFLLEAVAHTAGRASAERQVRDLSAKLSDLETQYLASTQSLTPARAQSLGFVTPTVVTTVYTNAASHSLSLAEPVSPSQGGR
jgi:hypothetical protein